MKKVEWLSPDSFSLNGLLFVTSSAQKAEARGGIYTMKSPILLDLYNDRIVRSAPKCIVEVGCMGGGSVIFLNEYFDPEVVLMIDRENSTTPAFAKYLGTSPKASRLRPHLDVDQRDGATILQLVDKEFSGKRPGLIIDDASHLYEHTKTTFEYLFPLLEPAGTYIIEDWAWGNWDSPFWQAPDSPWANQHATTNLVFQIVMASASNPKFVAGVHANYSGCTVERGADDTFVPGTPIENYYVNRGKTMTLI